MNPYTLPQPNPMRQAQAAPPQTTPQQPSMGQKTSNFVQNLSGAITSPSMLPWLSMAFGPTKQAQFEGMTGGIKYMDEAKRADSQFAQDHALREQNSLTQREYFDLQKKRFDDEQAQKTRLRAMDEQTNAFLSEQLRGKYSAEQIGMMRIDPTLRMVLENDLRQAGVVAPKGGAGITGKLAEINSLTPEQQQQARAAGLIKTPDPVEAPDLPKYLMDAREQANTAAQSLGTVKRARELLDSGITTGSLAEARNEINKFAKLVGLPPVAGGDPAKTDEYVSLMAKQTAAIIQAFGSGTAISDADREYAQKAAGAQITLDETALRNLLDIAERAATPVVEQWNATAEGLGQMNPTYKTYLPVRVPDLGSSTGGGSGVIDYRDLR